MKRQKELLALACAAYIGLMLVALTGCATDKLRNNSYKMLGSYTVAVETAADVAENPLTPDGVVKGIKDAKDVASPVVKTFHDQLRDYADLQDQIAGIRAAGGIPSVVTLAQVDAALIALEKSYEQVAPLIADLINHVGRKL